MSGASVVIPTPDDGDFIRRCRQGSEAAYAEVIHQHSSRLRTIACWLTGSRAAGDEVAQATLLDFFREVEGRRVRPPIGRWLDARCVRRSRRAAWHRRSARSASGRAPSDVEELAWALDRLPFTTRAAVVLRYVVGLDLADVAATLELPRDTCRRELRSGLQALRGELDGEGAPHPGVGARNQHGEQRAAAGPASLEPETTTTREGALSPCK